jgi:putative phage-type endonuclease
MSRSDWLDWRRKGIGASDSPAIMGVSPYKTAIQIWEDKTSTEKPVEMSSRIMEKGNELEPIARKQFAAHYNLINDADETFEPMLAQLEELPFMKASLDGSSHNKKIIVEIKFQGKENHEKIKAAVNGPNKYADGKDFIRIDYWTQMQHQFICSNADEGYLVSINEASTNKKLDVVWIKIMPDREYHKKHLAACITFWDCVVNKRRPELTEDDFMELEGCDELVEAYKVLKAALETYEKNLDDVKSQLLAKVTHPKMKANGLRISQVERAGGVDYKKFFKAKGIDEKETDSYRKAPTKYYKIDLE